MAVYKVLFIAVLLGLAACTTPPNRSVYRPSEEEGIASAGVDSHDYQLVMEKMVSSMLKHGLGTQSGQNPIIALGPINNHTPYHIEARMIGEDIRLEIMRSGLARFSTATDFEHKGGESRNLYKQLEFQNESGHVSPSTVARYGKIVGADYILYGNIYAIERSGGGKTEANFKFTLTLTEVRTSIAVWSDTKPIRKML